MNACASCRAFAAQLRVVEDALHTYPPVSPPPSLVHSIVSIVSREDQTGKEEWQPLPWDVWLPGAAFALALLIAMMSMPPHLLTRATLQELESIVHEWPEAINAWLAPLQATVRTDLFWTIWCGLFATTAGLGLGLGLVRWNAYASKRLRDLETSVSNMASWLFDRVPRAH